MEHEYHETVKGDRKVVWYYDVDFEPEPPGDDPESMRFYREECEDLDAGRLVALVAVPLERVTCSCPNCDGWHHPKDDGVGPLGGILTDGTEKELLEIAEGEGWV